MQRYSNYTDRATINWNMPKKAAPSIVEPKKGYVPPPNPTHLERLVSDSLDSIAEEQDQQKRLSDWDKFLEEQSPPT